MQPIPMINTEHVARVARLLEGQGVRPDRYLDGARIPHAARGGVVGYVPGHSLWALVGAVHEREALGDFWLDAAQLADWRHAPWVHDLTHAETLGDALRAMCSSYARHVPMNQLGVQPCGEDAWFWRKRTCDVHDWPGNEPAEQYTLSFMLAVIRAALPGWMPERLRVECSRSGWVAATRSLRGVDIECGQPLLAIHIPSRLLALPVSITPSLPETGDDDLDTPPTSYHESLQRGLELWLDEGLPAQEEAAELFRSSPRTLRRHLAEEGTSWRAVVDDLKFSKAVSLLLRARSTEREIAQALGYSDTSHFIRFFRRRAGAAPGAYLEQMRHALEPAQHQTS